MRRRRARPASQLGLHEDPATDEVQAAGETQRRAYFGGDLGRRGDDGARELVASCLISDTGYSQ